ncbi:MAG: inorganic pyrophosphatase [bacterium]|nr:inorganic pyrophosphatase [bacterium]
MSKSESLQLAKKFLGKKVEVVIDRPLGSKHPKFGFVYEVNYGFVSGTKAPDGKELDAYFLGLKTPVEKATGVCKAVIHRLTDDDDKLVVMSQEVEMSDEEILKAVQFMEKWFKHELVR